MIIPAFVPLLIRFKWPLIIGAVLIALGGAAWHINDSAYNRGRDETVAKMEKVIKKQREEVLKDVERHRNMTPDELDAEWRKACREAGGGEVCEK